MTSLASDTLKCRELREWVMTHSFNRNAFVLQHHADVVFWNARQSLILRLFSIFHVMLRIIKICATGPSLFWILRSNLLIHQWWSPLSFQGALIPQGQLRLPGKIILEWFNRLYAHLAMLDSAPSTWTYTRNETWSASWLPWELGLCSPTNPMKYSSLCPHDTPIFHTVLEHVYCADALHTMWYGRLIHLGPSMNGCEIKEYNSLSNTVLCFVDILPSGTRYPFSACHSDLPIGPWNWHL